MKVLLVVEKNGTAICRIAELMYKAAPWHSYRIVAVHPKRPTKEQLDDFQDAQNWCDVIDFRYWKTSEFLRSMFAITKPCMLTHYNPYDLTKKVWSDYKINVVVNQEQHELTKYQTELIQLPIDLDYWKMKETPGSGPYQWEIIMVANRIEAKKGILPVAKIAGQMKIRMLLVGSISDPAYYDDCVKAAEGYLTFQTNIPDDQLQERYKQSMMHICNSVDGFESGTMPILEAMACGTPVITRRVGHVPELFNGRNMWVRKSDVEDTNELRGAIQELLNDEKFRSDMAHQARATLRSRTIEYYGRQYSKLYHRLRSKEPLVSVVIPTVSGPEQLTKVLASVVKSPLQDMEIIVCDDSDKPEQNEALIAEFRKSATQTLKFYKTATFDLEGNKTYGLARARNKAILEAEGEWMMFVDDRLVIEPNAIEEFLKRKKDNTWLWGIKDDTAKRFVENFSFIKREDIIRIGMFSEQITQYGGMTQEVRTRAELNKMEFQIVDTARATEAFKSRSKWIKYTAIAKSKAQCYKLYG